MDSLTNGSYLLGIILRNFEFCEINRLNQFLWQGVFDQGQVTEDELLRHLYRIRPLRSNPLDGTTNVDGTDVLQPTQTNVYGAERSCKCQTI